MKTTSLPNEQAYQVRFAGELLPGVDLEKAKAAIAQLFKANQQQIQLFFSGKPVVVKSGLSKEAAAKYAAAFKKAGTKCIVEETPKPASLPVEFRLAPTGARLGPQSPRPRVPKVEIDHMDVLPVGSDLGVEDNHPSPEAPSVDHLSMAPVGSTLGDEQPFAPVSVPDISHLSMQNL